MFEAKTLLVAGLSVTFLGCHPKPREEERPFLKLSRCSPVASRDNLIGVVRNSAQKNGYEFFSSKLLSPAKGQSLTLRKEDLEVIIILTQSSTNIAYTVGPKRDGTQLPGAIRVVEQLPLSNCMTVKSAREFG